MRLLGNQAVVLGIEASIALSSGEIEMSDQDVQTSAGPVPYGGARPAETFEPVFYRRAESGFGPAALVAMVFVVVAILAQSIFSNRDVFAASDAGEEQSVEGQTGAAPVAPVEENPTSMPRANP
jgi:hypothetical protein